MKQTISNNFYFIILISKMSHYWDIEIFVYQLIHNIKFYQYLYIVFQVNDNSEIGRSSADWLTDILNILYEDVLYVLNILIF